MHDFDDLLYPHTCAACAEVIGKNEKVFCAQCQVEIPKTDFHTHDKNQFYERLWGRFPFNYSLSFFWQEKGNKTQHLLHELKYRDRTQAGLAVGKWYGEILSAVRHNILNADIIVPVPLHAKKKHQRGYNQSDFFAEGLSESMQISWRADAVARIKETGSQTRKNKYQRWENVRDIFEVKKPELLENKHVILVDDVVTTGSTLEGCAKKILEVSGSSISLITIAMAH